MFRALSTAASTCLALTLASYTGCGHPSAASPLADRAHANSPDSQQTESQPSTAPTALENGETDPPAAVPSEQTAAPAAPAEPATPPPAKRPPADRTVMKPGDAEKITFDDLNLGMQADVVFRPFMITDRVKDLEGKRISIIGYMHGAQSGQRGIKEFILLKNTECKFGPGGQADHLTDVKLKPDSRIPYTPSPLKVEGTLVLEPFQGPDGNTWSIYRLEGAQVRPQ